MGAVELASLKAEIPGLSGTASDAALTATLAIAEAQVAALCGWPAADDGVQSFASSSYTLYLQGSHRDRRRLALPLHVTAVSSVREDAAEEYPASSEVDSGDYELRPDALIRTEGRWLTARRGVRVACTAGWAAGEEPVTLRAAVVAMARHRWTILRTSQGVPQSSSRQGSQSPDALSGIPRLVRELAAASPAWRARSMVGG